ncbi:MAG: hypothetical protein ACFFDI_32295 [Promethearchaeota archaeon]
MGITTEIDLDSEPLSVKYEAYTLGDDLSIVAYAPIPLTMLYISDEDMYEPYSDDTKVAMSRMDLQLMLLSEIYFAYRAITTGAPSLRFDVILLDFSIGGVMNTHGVGIKEVEENIIGYKEMDSRRPLTKGDFFIAMAHPFSERLQIPSPKRYSRREFLLRHICHAENQSIELGNLTLLLNEKANSNRFSVEDIVQLLKRYEDSGIIQYEEEYVKISERYRDSWDNTKRLFRFICKKVFDEKRSAFLKYKKQKRDPINDREILISKWFSHGDLSFLISVGLRMLIEKSWEYNVMLIGVAKDSSSRYLTRNYLSVMKHLNVYDFDPFFLPSTDRGVLETIPFIDESVESPYASIEYDSCYMTLKRWFNQKAG